MMEIQVLPAPPRQSKGTTGGEPGKKYYLSSELGKNVKTNQIGEKIMDTPVQLSIREILAVSGEVAGYLHDQTRKRRIPIDGRTPAPAPNATTHAASATSSIPSVNVNSVDAKAYYALPSGHAKVTLDNQLSVNATLDNGSEVNMIPRYIFEQLDLPIDTDIRWRINAYDTDSELDGKGPIGVCHDVPINLGGVEVKQHVFVVEHSNADLILGRPWERAVRARMIGRIPFESKVRMDSVKSNFAR